MLSEGNLNLLKALAVTLPCTLVWYAIRHWKRTEKNRR
jgi:hypothetical protein